MRAIPLGNQGAKTAWEQAAMGRFPRHFGTYFRVLKAL